MNSLTSPQILTHANVSLSFTPFGALWAPQAPRVVVVGENPRRTGNISIFALNIPSSGPPTLELDTKKTTKSGIKSATLDASPLGSARLATGDFGGQLCIWDLDRLPAEPLYRVSAHEEVVNCVAGCGGQREDYACGAPELATASRDGHVRVWDPRSREAVVDVQPTAAGAGGRGKNDCWTVCFGGSWSANERSLVCGYENGDVKLLDLRQNRVLWETNVGKGVVSLEFDRVCAKRNKLVVCSMEARYRVYDCTVKHAVHGFSHLTQMAHGSTVWQGKHLPQNRDLWCTTGGNGSVSLWKYTYPSERVIKDKKGRKRAVMGDIELLAEQKIGDQPIVSWSWHQSKLGLACCVGLDQTVKVVVTTKLNKV